ncbi:MAG: RluA family pseudouridine synthase [Acidobacteria bacterium]|uniref:Pseudouridine synthase n=1 Tax=Candidatus Polarisedimenticola svalbardensis TaxID=2886004 RepID=A0A8J7C2G8_9BACT|nr:RluA family pseudouridine synthase [Candidatus Polarisedimenticola svalbardensis]
MSEPTTVYPVGRADVGKRLDRFLQEKIPRLSRSRIQEMIRARVLLSWDARVRPATVLVAGGVVRIDYVPLPETILEQEIPVLARGDGWLAVDKPAGIPVHPVNKVRENTVIRMLRRQEGNEELRLAHRLDRETSGVLLVAENSSTARTLSMAFENRQVKKEYLAVVRGVVQDQEGTIRLPVGKAPDSRVYVRQAAVSGYPSETGWQVEARGAEATMLRLFPRTGRRHQIRVHLEAIGHPVLGDLLYGRPDQDYLDLVTGQRDARKEEGGPDRQLLHCARLVIGSGPGALDCRASLPTQFHHWLEGSASSNS